MAAKPQGDSVMEPDHVELVAGRVAGPAEAIEAGRIDPAQSTIMYVEDPAKLPQTELAEQQEPRKLTKIGLCCLLAQQASSTWNARTAEFSFYLFLIILFPDTLLLASIYGFCTTAVSILFSAWVGGVIDKTPRLNAVRIFLVVQKLSIVIACSAFLGLFIAVKPVNYKHAPASAWIAFTSVVLAGCALSLANVGHSIAVERDWVTTIAAKHSEDTLTRLNAYMRRIDLLCKLLAPLFISLLTTTVSYTFATAFQLGFAALTLVFELLWVQVVFRKFPMLLVKNASGTEAGEAGMSIDDSAVDQSHAPNPNLLGRCLAALRDWQEFSRMPVFSTALAISFLYLTVLSFDGTLIAYLKEREFKDAFIAGQRGICVVTGLLGTIVMPWLEKRIGLVRTGAWAIVSEALCLSPVLASFYIPMQPAADGPAWSAALLFGGLAASRIGLWAFDLAQLKELQLALNNHPKRNRFMGLQFSMQSMADLAKYIVTIILSRPHQFRWATLISFLSVCAGVISYGIYVKKERKHLFHPEWIPFLRKEV